jgi:hypothetical protein
MHVRGVRTRFENHPSAQISSCGKETIQMRPSDCRLGNLMVLELSSHTLSDNRYQFQQLRYNFMFVLYMQYVHILLVIFFCLFI